MNLENWFVNSYFNSLAFTQVEVEYVVATSDEDLYFLAANQRQDLTSDKETMSHTTLQRIFSVINCKARMERTHGEMSNLMKVV